VVDLSILDNTGINTGTSGKFLQVDGPVDGINLQNNLYVAKSAMQAVYVADSSLHSFKLVDGNIWNAGGTFYVGGKMLSGTQWEATTQVADDHFASITTSSLSSGGTYKISFEGDVAGSALPLAA